MRKTVVTGAVLMLILVVCSLGCTACHSTAQPDNSSDSDGSSPLPDIGTFSSTEYIQTAYMFPKIKSALFLHDGITETLSPDDPRLIRLLNSLSFSYEQGYTSWRQGHVEEDEFLGFVNSGYPMLDIHFELDESSENDNEFSNAPRIIISANRYLLLVDTTQSTWMADNSIYANEHFPYVKLLCDYYGHLSEAELGEIYGDLEWGNNKWIDLLAYAGFE